MQKILSYLWFLFVLSCAKAELRYERPIRDYSVDETVSPCTNYHAYVCNRVEREFRLPRNRARHSFAFSDSAEALLSYKKAYLERLASSKPATPVEERLKNTYLACMNVNARATDEEAHVQRIRKELSTFTDRKSLLDYFAGKVFSGDAGFVGVHSRRNLDDPGIADAYLLPRETTLPERSYYLESAIEKDLVELFKTFYESLGVTSPDEKAQKLFAFEKRLAEVFPTPGEFREIMNRRSMAKKSELRRIKNLRLSKVIDQVPAPTSFDKIARKALLHLDRELGTLPIGDLKAFYLYYATAEFLEESQRRYAEKAFAFKAKYLGGPPEKPTQSERCTQYVMKTYPMAFDRSVFTKVFPEMPKEKFIELAETIRKTLLLTLSENQWLSPQGKAGAIKKIAKAELMLVSPETEEQWNLRPATKVSPEHIIRNEIVLREALKKKDLAEFSAPTSRERWRKGPLDVNAYYVRSLNQFVLLGGILQPPFYEATHTREQNLAGIGTVIGHELGHAIDDKGRLYDEAGRLRNWMSEGDRKNLEARSRPLIEEFEAASHNGKLTLGENTGDNVGLTTSFRAAFPEFASGKYPKEKLREFFLQYARTYCEVQTESARTLRLRTNPHSLGRERINRQVRQQPGFAEAYSCRPEDPMNLPDHKRIRIW